MRTKHIAESERCPACGGYGSRAYGSTATWHGGIGGQMITEDVCDSCWGSGKKDEPWTNLREVAARIRGLEARVALLPAITGPAAEGLRALLRYVHEHGCHKRGCPAYGHVTSGHGCTCGYDAAKQGAYDIATAMTKAAAEMPHAGRYAR